MTSVIWHPRLDKHAERYRQLAAELTERHFAPAAEEIDREQRYPKEHVKVLVDSGLAGLFVPEEFGGQGASMVATCAAMEELAKGCASTSAILSAYILGAFPIVLAGTEEQKHRYLGALARDGDAVSFALTEREAGSDAAASTTTAEPDGDGVRLRGEKCFIGNGGASRYYCVFAKAHDAGDGRSAAISTYMVDREADGVTIDFFEDKMGIRGTLTSNLKLDTTVPSDALVGEPGRGLRLALGTLDVARIAVGAQALGLAMAAFEEAARRAASRQAFGRPIIDNQGIAFPLADVATGISAARMLMYEAARAYDEGRDLGALGAMSKLYASEVSHRAVDVAVQVFGGYGYCKPHPVERYYRDQRIIEIYEGTSEIQRLVIGRAIKKAATDSAPAGVAVGAP